MMGGRTGRRRRGKIGLLVLTAMTACGLVWGVTTMAGASSSPSPAAEKVVFRVGTLQDIDSLNPFAGVTVAAVVISALAIYPLLYLLTFADRTGLPG